MVQRCPALRNRECDVACVQYHSFQATATASSFPNFVSLFISEVMVTGEPRAGKVHVCCFLNFPCTVCNVAFCVFIYLIFFYLGVSKLGGTCIAGFYWRFGKGMDFEESNDHLQLWPINS